MHTMCIYSWSIVGTNKFFMLQGGFTGHDTFYKQIILTKYKLKNTLNNMDLT